MGGGGASSKEDQRKLDSGNLHRLSSVSELARGMCGLYDYEAEKLAQAAREMGRYSLHICGISETHWSQSGELNLSTRELSVHSGHDEGPHRGGAVITLRYWKHKGPRIIIASFTTKHKGINLNIIQAYAPTNEAAEEDKWCHSNGKKTLELKCFTLQNSTL